MLRQKGVCNMRGRRGPRGTTFPRTPSVALQVLINNTFPRSQQKTHVDVCGAAFQNAGRKDA